MNVLFVDKSGDGLLDLAIRAQALGHKCRYYLGSYDPVKRPVGRGLIDRVPDWRPSMKWADLVILGGNGTWMMEMDRWRAEGVPIIGGGVESAKWELDRLAGMAAFKKAKIPIPGFRQCRSYEEALAVVADKDEGFAVKPCGDVADKSLSFVAKSGKEMVWRLQRWKKEGKKFPHGLILQERIEGIEFAVGGWFGPAGFVEGWEENHEFKKMFAGDIGPNTGELGTVMRLVKKSKLAEKVLKPLEEQLHRIGYCGNIDVNTIIDPEGTPHPLEFTMRMGYPAINIELALHDNDPIEFLACVASGSKPPMRVLDTIAVGVVMAIPPFPFGNERTEEVVGVPIYGVVPSIEDNLHFCDAMMDKGQLATAGSYVLVSTGTGKTVVEARRQALRMLNRLSVPASPYWRIDIGGRLRSQLADLQSLGFATGAVYA